MQPLILDLLKLRGDRLTIREILTSLVAAHPEWTGKDRQAVRSACLDLLNTGVVTMDSHYRLTLSQPRPGA